MLEYQLHPVKAANNFAQNYNKLSKVKSRSNSVEDWKMCFISPVFTAYVLHYVDESLQGGLLSHLEYHFS